MAVNEPGFRRMTSWELEIMQKLMEPDFPGRDILRQQLKSATVKTIDENSSLGIKCNTAEKAVVQKTVPTEGEYQDSDGISVHILLHVMNGEIRELEIYKDDGTAISELAKPAELKVLILDS
ncbi:MAG: hypothetical protein PHW04_15155 [Candidatus Wallbacteria bacterium]|nr:hypothetical protein [Candidatus Wallbacteria bacterium]